MLYDSTILYRSFYVFVAASALFGLFLVYLVRPVESHREFVVHSLSTFEIVVVVAAVVYFVLVDLYFYLGYFEAKAVFRAFFCEKIGVIPVMYSCLMLKGSWHGSGNYFYICAGSGK